MYIPTRYIDTTEVERAVDAFIKTLGPEVVRVRYNIGEDWTGDPALYFRVVLSDEVSAGRDSLVQIAEGITKRLFEELQPLERWGLFPHARFRSNAEQNQIKDPQWDCPDGLPR